MESLETVRIGVIGPSWWFDFWHLPAIRRHPQAALVAVCGARPRAEDEAAAKYETSVRCYADWEQMLDTETLDGVIVCTPNDLHAPAALAALRRGLHVTCEKPIALNAEQAREMAATARERCLLGMSNFPYRDNPAARQLHEQVESGFLGTLLHVRGEYHGGFGLQRPPGWRGLRARSGAGILGDLGSHLIDLTRYVTGAEFRSVCSHSLTLLRDAATPEQVELVRTEDPRVGDRNDDSCAFLAELSGGATAALHTSWVAYQGRLGQQQEIEAYGTAGRLHFVSNFSGTFLRGLRIGESDWQLIWSNTTIGEIGPGEQAPEYQEDYFRPGRFEATNTTYRWIEAIRTRQAAVSPDLDDGWRAQEVIDAVIRSGQERRWVEVEGSY